MPSANFMVQILTDKVFRAEAISDDNHAALPQQGIRFRQTLIDSNILKAFREQTYIKTISRFKIFELHQMHMGSGSVLAAARCQKF
jgi:hypothetical protein